MASYDATIRLLADISPADKALDRLQEKIQAIKKASTIIIRGPSDASPGVKKQINGYSTLISLLERYKNELKEVPTLTKGSIFQDPGKGPIGDAFRKAKKEVSDLSIALANAGDNFKEVFQTQRESLGIGKDVRNYANQLEFAASILGKLREGFKDNTAEARNLEAAIRNIVNELQSVRPGSGLTSEIQSALGPRTQASPSGPFGISTEQINAALEQKAEKVVNLQQRQIKNLNTINTLRKAGLAVNQSDNLISAAGQQLRKGNVVEAEKLVKQAEEELATLNRVYGILRRIRNERRRERIQQGKAEQKRAAALPGRIAVGAAFPALFGAGPAGIIGGGVGEAFGPLGGVVGSAIGAQIDTFTGKIVELGKALNPTTADIDAVIASLGVTGKSTADLIKRLEELAGKQVALEEATARLALIVGDDGVKSLQELGDASTELGNALSKVTTQILADAAKLLAPITQGLAGQVESVSLRRQAFESSDPRIVLLRAQIGNRISPRNDEELAILKEIEKIQKQINEDAAAANDKALEDRINELSTTKQVLAEEERKLAIARLNGDILNDKVFNLEKEQIYAEYNINNQKVLKELAEKQLTYQETKNKFKANELAMERGLLDLTKKRVDAEEKRNEKARQTAERAAEQAAREARERASRLESAKISNQNSIKSLLAADLERTKVFEGERAALLQKLKQLDIELSIQGEIIYAQYKKLALQAKSKTEADTLYNTYTNQIQALNAQVEVETALTQQKLRQLNLQRELNKLQSDAEVAETARDITRKIQDAQRSMRSPFGGDEAEQTDLIVRQQREREDVFTDLNAKIKEQERILLDGSLAEAENAAISLNSLNAKLALYEQLLPQLHAVEQAQLRQNQLMEKYGFIANEVATAMSSAVQAVVTGTGTVEEAFATMFQNIGRAFLDMATQMLSQQLFMTVLRALGGGSGFNFAGGSAGAGLGAANLMGGVGPLNAGMFGFRANGGPVTGGSPYIVGERGPELFVPGRSGTVVPNHKLDGDNINVVVNVDAKGTSVQGNDQQGNQLGRVLSATIQQELIKQKRPGGLLA